MTTINFPALDGRMPLGFLASCGVLRLLSEDEPASTYRLSWDPTTANARLDSSWETTLDEVAEHLYAIASSIPDGALFPRSTPDFPGTKSERPRPDRIRIPRPLFRMDVDEWRSLFGAPLIDTWAPAMVTDQVVDGDRSPRPPDLGDIAAKENSVASTPFAAPAGNQTFSSMFGNALNHVHRDKAVLKSALAAWTRVPGVSGEYLDHHVLNGAVDDPSGKSTERGVPGATWLALMSYPLFPVHGRAGRALAGGWQVIDDRATFAWPLWETPLPIEGLLTLVTHPQCTVYPVDNALHAAPPTELSVFRICAARRRLVPARKFDGVLTPMTVAQVS